MSFPESLRLRMLYLSAKQVITNIMKILLIALLTRPTLCFANSPFSQPLASIRKGGASEKRLDEIEAALGIKNYR